MNVLNIDTATEIFGLGLLTTDGRWFDTRRKAGLKHAEIVMEVLDRTLKEAELTASDIELIVCAKGPGSFTGLRIGMATAKGIAAGLDIPLVSIITLDAMAHGLAWFSGVVMPVIDGRKKRVYTSLYREGQREGDLLDIPLADFRELTRQHGTVLLTGPAVDIVQDALGSLPGVSVDLRGAYGWNRSYAELGILKLENSSPDEADAGPEYIRKSDAELNLAGADPV